MIEYTVRVYTFADKYEEWTTTEWFLNGKLHREDGPAVIWSNGSKFWYRNDVLHREDGPAVEYANGTKKWYLNGKLHREDGPAVEYEDGTKEWHLNGKQVAEDEHPANAKFVEVDGVRYKLVKV